MDKYKIDGDYREQFYRKNPSFVNCMKKFLSKQEKGTLCRCLLVEEHKNSNGDVVPGGFYYTDKLKSGYAFTNRIDNWVLRHAITIHYFGWVYDKGVFNNFYSDELHKHLIGIRLTADIDAPENEALSENIKDKKKKVRVDILSDSKYVDDAKMTIKLIIDKLKEIDDGEIPFEPVIQFSGNGFYVRLNRNFYGTESEISEVVESWHDLLKDVNHKTGLNNIDVRRDAWNRFYKVPFTFHSSFNRMSIILPENFDLDYLLKFSNPDNYLGGKA